MRFAHYQSDTIRLQSYTSMRQTETQHKQILDAVALTLSQMRQRP